MLITIYKSAAKVQQIFGNNRALVKNMQAIIGFLVHFWSFGTNPRKKNAPKDAFLAICHHNAQSSEVCLPER